MKKKYLYSPWRIDYILSAKPDHCIFCNKHIQEDDEKDLIVHRDKYCYIILNVYPYNNGHIMVVPYKHVPSLRGLNKRELINLFETVQKAEIVLTQVYHCEGINIGINIGKSAGAGVDEHIHVHLVPRWAGDCNFMSVVGGKRVIPEGFSEAYNKLRNGFSKINEV